MAVNNLKLKKTILEAKNNYWNFKHNRLLIVIGEYPEFKDLLENYFENIFIDKY